MCICFYRETCVKLISFFSQFLILGVVYRQQTELFLDIILHSQTAFYILRQHFTFSRPGFQDQQQAHFGAKYPVCVVSRLLLRNNDDASPHNYLQTFLQSIEDLLYVVQFHSSELTKFSTVHRSLTANYLFKLFEILIFIILIFKPKLFSTFLTYSPHRQQ